MHKHARACKITGTGGKDKAAVVDVLQRRGNLRTAFVTDRTKASLQAQVLENVVPGSTVYTDALNSCTGFTASSTTRPSTMPRSTSEAWSHQRH
jgi:transposase-like protein